MVEYHFLKLSVTEKIYYRKLLKAIDDSQNIVRVSPIIDKSAIKRVNQAINFDHPELFFVDFHSLNLYQASAEIMQQINYLIKDVVLENTIKEIEKEISSIVKKVNDKNLKNDYEKIRWIHNYLVRNVRYDYDANKKPSENPESFNVTGALHNKRAVCEGISKAFKLLCDRMDVYSIIIEGNSNFESCDTQTSHAWNIVKINNQFSHIDVTWDANLSENCRHTLYDYFCLSDKRIRKDHTFESYPVCDSEEFSYFSKRKRRFSNANQLNLYIENELKNKKNTLYFQIDTSEAKADFIIKKIQNKVRELVSKYYNSFSYQMNYNETQLTFFLKIINKE